MRRLRRSVPILVSACLLWAVAGCYTGRDYAHENSLRLSAGMSMEEVQHQIGAPNQIIRGDPGTETVWIYRYSGGTSTGSVVLTIFAVIFVVAIIAVLVVAAGGGGGGSWGGNWGGGGGSDDPPYQIRLLFDPDGNLVEVSPPHPAP